MYQRSFIMFCGGFQTIIHIISRQPFVEDLQQYVTLVFLEDLARKIGFIKRKRNFSGLDLATICI